MVISQPRNNPSYYYHASPTLPQLLWMLPETPYVLYMQLQHQGNSLEMVLLSIFFTRNQIRRDHQQIVLYSFVAPCACSSSSWFKILLQIFLYEDLSTLTLHTSVGCISLQECQQDRTLLRNQYLLSENIPNIWHKSSTKHKEVRPDWNDKNDNANYALVSHGRFYTMAQVAIF